jgi:lipid-A-disaccharide synthase
MGYLQWVGLPNILARRHVVPEFLQDEATPENLAQALGTLLVDRPMRESIEQVFAQIHRSLRQGTAQKAAAVVLPYLTLKTV